MKNIVLILVTMLGFSGMAQAVWTEIVSIPQSGTSFIHVKHEIYEVPEIDNFIKKINADITSNSTNISTIKTTLSTVTTDINTLKTDIKNLKLSVEDIVANKASATELAEAKKALGHLSQRFDVYDTFNKNNSCDKCLNLNQKGEGNLVKKLKCFSDEINLYEKDQKQWSVSCTARTVGYTKKILLLLKVEKGQIQEADNKLSDHLDDVYPYYNVISKDDFLGSK